MRKTLLAAAVIGSVLLSGCMATMTPEQQAKVKARMAEPPQPSISTLMGTPRDREELIKRGEVSSW